MLKENVLSLSLKDEAFDLWYQHWGSLYPKDSHSREIIEVFEKTYFLINLVDNDFVKGNCLWELLEEVFKKIEDPTFESEPIHKDTLYGMEWTKRINCTQVYAKAKTKKA